jgi:hypothetical protein
MSVRTMYTGMHIVTFMNMHHDVHHNDTIGTNVVLWYVLCTYMFMNVYIYIYIYIWNPTRTWTGYYKTVYTCLNMVQTWTCMYIHVCPCMYIMMYITIHKCM